MILEDKELVFIYDKYKNRYAVYGKSKISLLFRDWVLYRAFRKLGMILFDDIEQEWYYEINTMFVGGMSFSHSYLVRVSAFLKELNDKEKVFWSKTK